MKKNITNSDHETKKLGEAFAQALKPGDVVFIYGDLGFGKTTFVKGVAKGLGIKTRIISPTFPIIRKHKNLYHIDLYRIESERQLDDLGLQEIIEDKCSIKLIEWPEKLQLNGRKHWSVRFELDTVQDNRTIEILYE